MICLATLLTTQATALTALPAAAPSFDARALLDADLPAEGPARALALATLATRVQAPGIATSALATSASASDLARAMGVEADVSALDEHPEVARLLAAFMAFDSAARSGDAAGVFGARLALLDAALDLRAVQADDVVAPPVLVLRFGASDDVYTEDVALVYDAGGNDVYRNNAGGSGLATNLNSCVAHVPPTSAALFDLAGDDVYGVPTRGCGAVGGAATGAGLLYDETGHDRYLAANDGAIGGGTLGGIGFLLDMEGDDVYAAGGWGTNGGAYPGAFGLLVDDDGDDAYSGTHDAVNGGAFLGVGMLLDTAGDDSYFATGSAANGGASGGRGLLLDGAGDDAYVVEWGFASNGGAIAGVGLLHDDGGHDWYFDPDGGTGWDVTVLAKETTGVQYDG